MASSRKSNGTFKRGTHWRKPKPHWDREWLCREYVTNQRSAQEIATDAGCRETNIFYWLSKHGIERRTIGEARQVKKWGAPGEANPMFGKCDEAHPGWKGGISPERQKQYARAMWKAIKNAVLSRDNFTCCRCGIRPAGKRETHTHHIKGWTRNPSLRFDTSNIITLCRKCHQWIHSRENRDHELLG